jgi:hypothetical protein
MLPPRGHGSSSTTRLAAANLMGPGCAAVLPRLDGAPAEYRISHEDPRAILLARKLTTLGIAEPQDWERAEHSTSGYILATLERWITRHGGKLIRQQFGLYALISSTADPCTEDGGDPELLYLIVNPDSAGYVVIGPTLDLLAGIHPRLPFTFYQLFVNAVRRWARVYDFEDALDRVEMLREWVAGEENPEEYELPDVEGCIPAYMKEQPLDAYAVRRIADEIKDERIAQILSSSLDLDKISQRHSRVEMSHETREVFMDSNPPLPALLVTVKRDDAVGACWDEESQGMLEAEPEPNMIVEIDPGETASVRLSFELLGTFCDTVAAASRLASLLPGNEEA